MFPQELQSLLTWIDTDATRLDKEQLRDAFRVRVLCLMEKFIAYPHCSNFSLMPDEGL